MIRNVGGIVKGGVIIPDAPLPENAYVEIVVANATRELVNRVRTQPAPCPSASDGCSSPGVTDFLRHHAAEQAFAALLRLARACFPEVKSLAASLAEDRDEPGLLRVVVEPVLPAGHALELLRQQRRRFDAQFDEVVSLEHAALFVVVPRIPRTP